LNELEKQYTEEKAKQKGFNFNAEMVSNLSRQIAKTKELIATTKELKFTFKSSDFLSGGGGKLFDTAIPRIELAPVGDLSSLEISGAGMPGTEEFYRKSIEDIKSINEAVEEYGQAAWDAQRDYAVDRINEIKSAAGGIFDSLMSGSKDIWSDLLRTFKSIFLAPVRMAFQNLAVGLFGGGGFSGGQVAGSGGMAVSGGMAGLMGSLGIAGAIGGSGGGYAQSSAGGGLGSLFGGLDEFSF